MLFWAGGSVALLLVVVLCVAAYGRHVRVRKQAHRLRPAFDVPVRDRVFVEAADAVEITLGNGKSIRVKPLNVRAGTYFYRLFLAAARGQGEAMNLIMDEFPAAVGCETACEDLTVAEFWELFRRFLSLRRTPDGAKTTDDPARLLMGLD